MTSRVKARPALHFHHITRPGIAAPLLGALAACGFAPLEMVTVTLLAVAGWMLLVHRAPSLRSALWRGWLFGVGHFTVNDNWFQHAFDFQDKMPPVLGYFAAVGLALYLAIYPMIAAGIAWRLRRPGLEFGFVLGFGAAWIATEYLRAVMFTGYAWDPLGVVWVPVRPIASLAAIIGTYALSGLTIVAAGTLVWLVRRTPARLVALAAVLITIQLLADRDVIGPPPATAAPGTPLLRVVQPNIDQNDRGIADAEPSLRAQLALSGRPGPSARLVLWPEGMVRDFIDEGYPLYVYGGRYPWVIRRRMAAVLGPGDLLLAGTTPLRFDADGNVVGASNSVQAIASDARIVARYDKAHLVPYGEYLPVPWLLKPLGLARLVPGDLDFDFGPGPRSLALPGFGLVGVQTCYEIIFSGQVIDRAHRPRLLFNPSNDAWFGRWGPPQHLAQARMRAIEEGLPIVRATPTGISAVIAADGRLLATIPPGRAGAIEMPIPPALPPTPFARAGNWMALLMTVFLALVAIAVRRHAR